MTKNDERATVALGHNQMAMVNKPPPNGMKPVNDESLSGQNVLRIMEASSYDEGGYSPAESVTISGPAIPKLRDLLLREYPPLLTSWALADLLEQAGGKIIAEIELDPDSVDLQQEAVKGIIEGFSQWGLNVSKVAEGDRLYITGSIMDGYKAPKK